MGRNRVLLVALSAKLVYVAPKTRLLTMRHTKPTYRSLGRITLSANYHT